MLLTNSGFLGDDVAQIIDPDVVAQRFRSELADEISSLGFGLKLVGLIGSDYPPSLTYARYTEAGCKSVGIAFEARQVDRFEIEAEILRANRQVDVHGVLIYYPIFNVEQDNYLKDLVDHRKDIEGLSTYWIRRLYDNMRTDDEGNKAILPCTPLAIMKLLHNTGSLTGKAPLTGKTVTIFNRSEVVGRPLAAMMAHDGARVFSFDIDGPQLVEAGKISSTKVSRQEALAQSDIIITGVPSRDFDLITPEEVPADAIGLNFSTVKNFSKEAKDKLRIFVPRVGPMTVTMALRNTLRLYKNYRK